MTTTATIVLPTKGGGGEDFEKAKRKFFQDILEGIRKHIDFSIVKAVLVGR